MRLSGILLSSLGALSLAAGAHAQALYASTASGSTHGELYILNPATGGTVQDVGSLNDVTGLNYTVTGMTFDPISGLLYGSTASSPSATAHNLITIDPTTAMVTKIGSFNDGGATMTDLTIDSTTGTLYGVGSSGGPSLYAIDKSTGAGTSVGPSGFGFTGGGGVAADSSGTVWAAPLQNESLGTYNKVTGAFTANEPISGTPLTGVINAMSFDGSGTLFGLEGLQPGGRPTHLVTINTSTGAATDMGASLPYLDAIAFRPGAAVPEPGTLALMAGPALAGLTAFRRRRK